MLHHDRMGTTFENGIRIMKACSIQPVLLLACLVMGSTLATGCRSFLDNTNPLPITAPEPIPDSPESEIPREMSKVSLPAYTIEPPDVLIIRAAKIVPKFPYNLEALDLLAIQVTGIMEDQPPIFATFTVDPDGNVDLGAAYGKVRILGMTLDEASSAITRYLEPNDMVIAPEVSVILISSPGFQRIAGEHLVAPDGTVNLGVYGRVRLAGLTILEATDVINKHLSEYLESPKATIEVATYNSKVYYIITEGAGLGDSVVRVAITGSETVLDAIASIGGLSRLSSQRIWISRPTSGGAGCEQILPVDWKEITRGASTETNYQLMPGDRVFIAEDRLTAANTLVDKIIQPVQRIFGFVGLGTANLNRIERFGLSR